jgi:RND family efflux transporter MFP subunit
MTEQPKPLLEAPPHHLQLEKPRKKSRIVLVSIIALIIFIAVAGIGIASRAAEERKLNHSTRDSALPAVAVISAQRGAVTEDVVLPGTIQAWHDATIYARTAGYLKTWNVDIGTHVKEGDILAVIDAPDLDAQFHQAQADVNTAIANNTLAQITAKRYIELRKTDSVSQQQVDTQVATAQADQATVESQKANLDHLQQEEDFKTVVAPFDGIITARNTDVGALINGGNSGTTGGTNSSTTGQNLFQIAETDKLRVYVQVPENESSAITPNIEAELHLPQYPQRVFPAKLTQTANALDPSTRTLLIQLEADNEDGTLLSGGYTDVHFKIPTSTTTVILPVNALLFRDGMQAAVVTNNKVSLKTVKIGRDYGKSVEIVDGLSPGDIVVVNPPDSLEDGQNVRVIKPKDQKDQDGKNADQDKSKAGYESKDQKPTRDQDKSNDAPAQKDEGQPQADQKSGGKNSGSPTDQSQNASEPDGSKPMTEDQKPNSQNTK